MNNESGIKNIIKLFLALQNNGLTQTEIQDKFNIKEQTFYKYMKYLKDACFDICKYGNKYTVNAYSDKVILNSNDISSIADMCILCENLLSDKESDEAQKIIKKLLLMSSSDIYKHVKRRFLFFRKTDNYKKYREKINLFEKYLNQGILIYVTIKSKNSFRAKPYKVSYKKNKVYFNFLTQENKVKTILADRIVDIQPEYMIKTVKPYENETIFEIYGNLAKTYILREDEVIIDNLENGIRILSGTKDKRLLFKRLLRYDVLCKIIHPESDRIKFKELIDNTLENLCKE